MTTQNERGRTVGAVPSPDNQKPVQPIDSEAPDAAQALNEAHLKSAAVIRASGKRTVLEALQAVERGQTVDDVLSHYEARLRILGASS